MEPVRELKLVKDRVGREVNTLDEQIDRTVEAANDCLRTRNRLAKEIDLEEREDLVQLSGGQALCCMNRLLMILRSAAKKD